MFEKKHNYEEFTCGTVKISFVLYMLLIQYLQFVDGDLSSNGRIVQFYRFSFFCNSCFVHFLVFILFALLFVITPCLECQQSVL